MLHLSGGNVSKVRNVVLSAAILVVVYILFQSFRNEPLDIRQSTKQSLQAITPGSWRNHAPGVMKVTSLFGESNELYEAAVASHAEHNRLNGYEFVVFREKIVERYWSIPTLLLSTLMSELAKEPKDRTEWILWVAPDVMVLNPQIPLEVFLPPKEFDAAAFLGTQDEEGLNDGVFFLRVHQLSVRMLIEVLSIPRYEFGDSPAAGQQAFEKVLRSDQFRDHVYYQPRTWYNAFQLSVNESEAKPGDLFVHFHGLRGDKWSAMADTSAKLSEFKSTYSKALKKTDYEAEIKEYWNRIRAARELLANAQPHMFNPSVEGPFRRLEFATTYLVDDVDVMNEAMEKLKEISGIQ